MLSCFAVFQYQTFSLTQVFPLGAHVAMGQPNGLLYVSSFISMPLLQACYFYTLAR